jgi:hypothetical protein
MYGDKGTDPQGLRYEAGKYLVQNLLVKEAAPTSRTESPSFILAMLPCRIP